MVHPLGGGAGPVTGLPLSGRGCDARRVTFDVARRRADFPALREAGRERPQIYLDSAATAHKPAAVIEAVVRALGAECAAVHRGAHARSAAATERFEVVRERARRFLGAEDAREIVFTSGATASLNLVARSFGASVVGPGDEILVSLLEHHANLLPWQALAAEHGARLRLIPLDPRGQIDLHAFAAMLSPRARIVAVTHVSNALGTVTPVREIARLARRVGAAVVVDGAQAVSHLAVDVRALGCDFYCFSGHKLFAPPGTGVLYGRLDRLEAMPPWQLGGGMVESVSLAASTFADPPGRFEAGTPNTAGVAGLGAAFDYVESVGLAAIGAWERRLVEHGRRALAAVPGLTLHGSAEEQAAILSFNCTGRHPDDVAEWLDHCGIAVRAGRHCAQPLMDHLGVPGTVRASLAFYNTPRELDALARALRAMPPPSRRPSV